MPETTHENGSDVRYPAFRPVPMPLFPVLDNLNAVVDLGISQLPINNTNQLISLLMTYHNTLIKQLEEVNRVD